MKPRFPIPDLRTAAMVHRDRPQKATPCMLAVISFPQVRTESMADREARYQRVDAMTRKSPSVVITNRWTWNAAMDEIKRTTP